VTGVQTCALPICPVDRVGVGVLLVVLGDGADAVRGKELRLVEEVAKHPFQTDTGSHGQQDVAVGVDDVAVHSE